MYRKNQLEGFLTFIVLLTVVALAFGSINNFKTAEDPPNGNTDLPIGPGGGGEGGDTDYPGNTEGERPGGEGNGDPDEPSPDEPQEPEDPEEPDEPTESECNHVDLDESGTCDKCGAPYSDGYEPDDYKNMPGSSMDNLKFSEFEERVPHKENGEIIKEYEVWKTEVDVNVLYWVEAFYSNDFELELDNILNIIPVTVEAHGYLYKVRITFNSKAYYDTYAKGINSDGACLYEYNEDELYVDILYYFPENLSTGTTEFNDINSDTIRYNSNGTIPKNAIASIEVYVRY